MSSAMPGAPQSELFGPATPWPEGLRLGHDFLTAQDEDALLAWIGSLDLQAARYKGYTARRRIASFGSAYDFERLQLQAAPPLPPALLDLRERVASWLGVPAQSLRQALVAEYAPGTPLGWHRDVPDFESVVGLSLAGPARLRLRPYPPRRGAQVLNLDLAPRSIYALQGPARWQWQHSVPPTPGLRYSITLRTPRARGARG